MLFKAFLSRFYVFKRDEVLKGRFRIKLMLAISLICWGAIFVTKF